MNQNSGKSFGKYIDRKFTKEEIYCKINCKLIFEEHLQLVAVKAM